MRRIAALLLICLGAVSADAQTETPAWSQRDFSAMLDSLRREADKLGGQKRAEAYEQIYYKSLSVGTLEDQVRSVNDFVEATRHADNKIYIVDALVQRAVLYYNNDMNDSVLTVVRRDLPLIRERGVMVAYYELWSHIANTYLFMNQNKLALRETEAMYADAKESKDDFGMGLAYSIMGSAYANMRSFDQSTDAFQKSIAMLSAIKPTPAVLPDVYTYYGNALADMKEFARLDSLTKEWGKFLPRHVEDHKLEGSVPERVYKSYYYLACAQAALGLGQLDRAKECLESARNNFSSTEDFEGQKWLYYMGQLQLRQGNAKEALGFNDQRMALLEDNPDMSTHVMVLRQRAEIMEALGRYGDAANLYRKVYLINDSINAADTKSQLTEMNTIFQVNELEMQNERNRFRFFIIVALVTVLSLAVFLFFRTRSAQRLRLAHNELQTAYADLQDANRIIEETTAAKERIESELRIARDIQMGMVPGTFPDRADLDLYAMMTPAREVGGDLYDYQIIGDDTLYFCVGDVSGKGVPASLFMAQATRLFRTLAKQQMMPAEIATRLNDELGEENGQGMFVTMFIGRLSLTTGHLDFCNAGHNPPVIMERQPRFLEMEPNQPIGLWPGADFVGETIDDLSGTPLFVYTDGLNEAEDEGQQQFGDDRLLRTLAERQFNSAKDTIETMKAEVAAHVAGAEPSDDLTMMCVLKK